MENCRVTELEGTINADLKKYGEVRIGVKVGKTLEIRFNAESTDDFSFIVNSGTATIAKTANNHVGQITISDVTSDLDLSFFSKYDCIGVNGIPVLDLSNLAYATNLGEVSCFGGSIVIGSINVLNGIDLQRIQIQGASDAQQTVSGSIDSLYADCPNKNTPIRLNVPYCPNITGHMTSFSDLPNMNYIVVKGTAIEGSIESLGKLKSLSTLTLHRGIRGSIEALVEAQCSTVGGTAARTSGTITMSQGTPTLNGVNFYDACTINFGASEVTVKVGSTTKATYNVSGDTWTYAS